MKLYKQMGVKDISLKEYPFQFELNMQSYIIENPEILSDYLDTSKEFKEIIIRTWELPVHNNYEEKKSKGSGRIDILAEIVCENPNDNILAIIELKNGKLIDSHLDQLVRYLSKFSENKDKILESIQNTTTSKKTNTSIENSSEWKKNAVIGILIGTDIDEDLKTKLLKKYKFTKGAFFLVGLIVANLSQYKHTASSFDASIPTRKNA